MANGGLSPEKLGEFMQDVDALPPHERTALKQEFFKKYVKADEGWAALSPQERFQFAKQFGIAPGFAQRGEGEFAQAGLLEKPKGDLGEVTHPPGMLGGLVSGDPVDYLTGGLLGAGRQGLTAMIRQGLLSSNPMVREAVKRAMSGAMDWGTTGLWRLPGALARGGAAAGRWAMNQPGIHDAFHWPAEPPRKMLPPAPGGPFPMPPSSLPSRPAASPMAPPPMPPPAPVPVGPGMPQYAKPRIRFGPNGPELVP